MTDTCTQGAALGLEQMQSPLRAARPTTERNSCPRIVRSVFPSPALLAGPGPNRNRALACCLPHRVARRGLDSQKEVLVEVPLFVAFKRHCCTDHKEDCGLAGVASSGADWQEPHPSGAHWKAAFQELTQGLLSSNSVSVHTRVAAPCGGGTANASACPWWWRRPAARSSPAGHRAGPSRCSHRWPPEEAHPGASCPEARGPRPQPSV